MDDGNAYATVAFADVSSTQVYMQATISDIYAAHDLNSFDIGFAPILRSEDSYAYELRQNYVSSTGVYERGIARLQGKTGNFWVNWANGTKDIVFNDTKGAWLNRDVSENAEGLIEGVTVTLTMIRDGNKVYVWTQLAGEEVIYHGVDVLDESYMDYEAGFGLFTRAGTGATFSDISFSTDAEFIADKLSRTVTVNADTNNDVNGTVSLVDAVSGEPVGNAMLGQELKLIIAPEASASSLVYYISEAEVGGKDVISLLEEQDGVYSYTFTVKGDTTVNVTIAQETIKTVSGTVTVPAGNEDLLSSGTIGMAGGSPVSIAANGTYSITVPASTGSLVVTVLGFSKTVALDTLQQSAETIDIALTAADYAFEKGTTRTALPGRKMPMAAFRWKGSKRMR